MLHNFSTCSICCEYLGEPAPSVVEHCDGPEVAEAGEAELEAESDLDNSVGVGGGCVGGATHGHRGGSEGGGGIIDAAVIGLANSWRVSVETLLEGPEEQVPSVVES